MKNIKALELSKAKLLEYNPLQKEQVRALRALAEDFINTLDTGHTVDELIANGSVLLLKTPLTGYVGFVSYKLTDKGSTAHLSFVCIASAERGKGYGKVLMERAIEYFKSIEQIELLRLGVRVGNDAAKALYESVGFKEYARGKDSGLEFIMLSLAI